MDTVRNGLRHQIRRSIIWGSCSLSMFCSSPLDLQLKLFILIGAKVHKSIRTCFRTRMLECLQIQTAQSYTYSTGRVTTIFCTRIWYNLDSRSAMLSEIKISRSIEQQISPTATMFKVLHNHYMGTLTST
jgi:hypothetical protein